MEAKDSSPMESQASDPILEGLCTEGYEALEENNTVKLAQALVKVSAYCKDKGLDVPEKAILLANVLANQQAKELKVTGFVPVLRPPP
jgi:hypothetical protein